jgi:hypothetical protein
MEAFFATVADFFYYETVLCSVETLVLSSLWLESSTIIATAFAESSV